MEKLNQTSEFDWVPVHFAAGAFVTDETAELVTSFGAKRVAEVTYHGLWGTFWAEQAARSGGVSPLQDALLRNASNDAVRVNKFVPQIRAAGVLIKVLKPIGPLLTVPGIVYDIRSGYSGRRAVFTNVAGFGVGAVVVAGLTAAVAWPAWVIVGAGALAGFAIGQFAAPWAYDEYIASPKERLLQQPNAPDLDPGPGQLSGE